MAEITCGDRVFTLTFDPARLGVEERAAERPRVRVRAVNQEPLFDVLFRAVPTSDLERSGALEVTGERAVWTTLRHALRNSPQTIHSGH